MLILINGQVIDIEGIEGNIGFEIEVRNEERVIPDISDSNIEINAIPGLIIKNYIEKSDN